jgi:hypothetical protein
VDPTGGGPARRRSRGARQPGARRPVAHRRASAHVRANLLEINPNEAYDPRRAATDDEEAYLYFRWRVELTPVDSTVDEDHQIGLARELVGVLAGDGVRTVVCANFEDRV